MATIQAVEDSTWLLLACSAQKRLAVSLIHDGDFPFPLKPSSHVQMRSNNTAAVSIVGKSIQRNLLFLDPGSLCDSIPLILQDDQLVISISEQDGTMHDYTFAIQPNDRALRSIRFSCLDF